MQRLLAAGFHLSSGGAGTCREYLADYKPQKLNTPLPWCDDYLSCDAKGRRG